jgi:hypothetical protein
MPDAFGAGFDQAEVGICEDRRAESGALQSSVERAGIVEEVDRQRINLRQSEGAAAARRFPSSQWEAHTFPLVRAGVVLIHGVGLLYVCRETT